MSADPDHYAVLGVHPDADRETIRRAYVAIARSTHPDRVAADPSARAGAARTIREANAAWNVLGDEKRRADYDRRRRGEDLPRATSTPAAPRTRIVTDWVGVPDEAPPTPATGWAWVGLVLFLVAVLAVVVGSAYAASGGSSSASTQSTVSTASTLPDWKVGDCVMVAASSIGRLAFARPCSEPVSGRIVAVVDSPRPCPTGTPIALPDGRTTLCLGPV
ncbi:MAG: J domain-containing protein [Acidimicrobiia bacterium]